jgi:hypothetical protein
MSQKLINLVKEWGKYGMFGLSGVSCLVIGELEKIKISSLISSIIAYLFLEYKEVL